MSAECDASVRTDTLPLARYDEARPSVQLLDTLAVDGGLRTVWRSVVRTTGAGATRVEVSYQVVIQSPIRLSSDRKDEFYHVKRDTTSAAVTATVELHFSIEFYILMHSVDKPDSR